MTRAGEEIEAAKDAKDAKQSHGSSLRSQLGQIDHTRAEHQIGNAPDGADHQLGNEVAPMTSEPRAKRA